MTEQQQPTDNSTEQTQAANEHADTVELSGEQAIIAKLEAELAQSKAQLAEQQDLMLRIKAESENVRRRASMDVEKAHKFALEKFAGDLLPVVDNLERALGLVDASNDSLKAMAEGLELTLRGFIASLAKFGVEVVEPTGQPFNPELHQAMSMVEHGELPANSVLFVMQKGYTLNGRLLRPAMVAVTRAPASGVDTSA